MLQKVRETVGCHCECIDALSLAEHFGPNRFDVVLSSECIEHTPAPMEAVRQMAVVLKPGGYLALSTPLSPNYGHKPSAGQVTQLADNNHIGQGIDEMDPTKRAGMVPGSGTELS